MRRKKKKQFIDLEEQRFGIFMNDNSFDLDIELGREYLKTDVNYFLRIYRVNIIESKGHDLYAQAKSKDKKFFPPVLIHAMVDIGNNEQNYYGDSDGGIVREDATYIVASVYLKELEEKGIEVNRGDILEYNLSGERPRYFEVESANNVTDTTSQTIAGFKPYWKRILGVPVKEDITPYLKGDNLS